MCIGEKLEEREAGKTFDVCFQQMQAFAGKLFALCFHSYNFQAISQLYEAIFVNPHSQRILI